MRITYGPWGEKNPNNGLAGMAPARPPRIALEEV